jgi:hypothetical protein
MANELQVFQYEAQQVRTVNKEDEPWFIARDVCEVLAIANTSQALARLPDVMKGLSTVDTPGGKQTVTVITEAGLYKLAFSSRKDEAEKFTNWVASDVLPQIRKTGNYSLPSSKNVYGILRGLVDDLERQDQQIAAVNLRVDKVIKGIPALPVPSNASEEFVTPSQIGRMFNPRLSGQEVNRLMKLAGLQYRVGDEYIPSDRGKIYAKTLPVQLDNGHCVFQLYWQRKVYNFISEILVECKI